MEEVVKRRTKAEGKSYSSMEPREIGTWLEPVTGLLFNFEVWSWPIRKIADQVIILWTGEATV